MSPSESAQSPVPPTQVGVTVGAFSKNRPATLSLAKSGPSLVSQDGSVNVQFNNQSLFSGVKRTATILVVKYDNKRYTLVFGGPGDTLQYGMNTINPWLTGGSIALTQTAADYEARKAVENKILVEKVGAVTWEEIFNGFASGAAQTSTSQNQPVSEPANQPIPASTQSQAQTTPMSQQQTNQAVVTPEMQRIKSASAFQKWASTYNKIIFAVFVVVIIVVTLSFLV